jgi:hypothetical protein
MVIKDQSDLLKRLLALLFLALPAALHANTFECRSTILLRLENIAGGVYSGQQITFTAKDSKQVFTATSDSKGEVRFELPCNTLFDVFVPNYARPLELQSDQENTEVQQTLTYAADMLQKEKNMQMTAEEKQLVDKEAAKLPDTVNVSSAIDMNLSGSPLYFKYTLTITDIHDKPLVGELVTMSGVKRNKHVKAVTNSRGVIEAYLLKGDTYRVHFKYDKNYSSIESAYTRGRSTIDMTLSYLGSIEIERRRRIEAERLIAEAKRIKEETERFEKYKKDLRLTAVEAHKKKITDYKPDADSVILSTFRRNTWPSKLIVSDLSGSMYDFSAQLAYWFSLNFHREKDLQLVFFNDGDAIPDDKKIIGRTGGIYYSKSPTVDSFNRFAARVSSAGYGGDVEENNMEALIKAINVATPFTHLVMVADNRSPVRDIQLLKDFTHPVRIILCGGGAPHEDYLQIAWKTKGSIHTIDEDITEIAGLTEGQEMMIGGYRYRIMGGRFVRL